MFWDSLIVVQTQMAIMIPIVFIFVDRTRPQELLVRRNHLEARSI